MSSTRPPCPSILARADALTVRVHAISASARTKIEGQGGRVEVLSA